MLKFLVQNLCFFVLIITTGSLVINCSFKIWISPIQAFRCNSSNACVWCKLNSPKILELSGIGNHKVLSDLGIQTKFNSVNVGENLQDHLQLRVIYKLENAVTLNQKANSLLGKIGIGLEYVLNRSGPMSMAPSQLGVFAMSDESYETPNLQFHVQPISTDKLGGSNLHDFDAFTPTVANIRPTSKGEINIISKDSRVNPKIKMNYL